MEPEVWVAWPTVNIERSNTMAKRWREMGYSVAILVNPPHDHSELPEADRVVVQQEWTGFPAAANLLCHTTPGDIVVVAGDDLYPAETMRAEEIGKQFVERFQGLNGLMQPTGDRYGCIDTCAVSPWIGRAFIEKAYEGRGPYWPGYYHYFSDEELQAYAVQMGCFQQRPDLSQYHDHWQRKKGTRPRYLRKAKTLWQQDRALFSDRKQRGFPA